MNEAEIIHHLNKIKANIKLKDSLDIVTPKKAKLWLDECENAIARGDHAQRASSPSNYNPYSEAMRTGNWGLSHGIVFSESGHLLDGRNRLTAIVASGVPALLRITRGWPDFFTNAQGMKIPSVALFDRGAPRTMVHIYRDFNRITDGGLASGVVKAVCETITQKQIKVRADQSLSVYELMGKQIHEVIAAMRKGQRERRVWILAPIAIWATKNEKAFEFAEKYVLGADLPTGSPILTLRGWLSRANCNTGSGRLVGNRAVMNALMAYSRGAKLDRLSSADAGWEWLRDQVPGLVRKVEELVYPPELKLAA